MLSGGWQCCIDRSWARSISGEKEAFTARFWVRIDRIISEIHNFCSPQPKLAQWTSGAPPKVASRDIHFEHLFKNQASSPPPIAKNPKFPGRNRYFGEAPAHECPIILYQENDSEGYESQKFSCCAGGRLRLPLAALRAAQHRRNFATKKCSKKSGPYPGRRHAPTGWPARPTHPHPHPPPAAAFPSPSTAAAGTPIPIPGRSRMCLVAP